LEVVFLAFPHSSSVLISPSYSGASSRAAESLSLSVVLTSFFLFLGPRQPFYFFSEVLVSLDKLRILSLLLLRAFLSAGRYEGPRKLSCPPLLISCFLFCPLLRKIDVRGPFLISFGVNRRRSETRLWGLSPEFFFSALFGGESVVFFLVQRLRTGRTRGVIAFSRGLSIELFFSPPFPRALRFFFFPPRAGTDESSLFFFRQENVCVECPAVSGAPLQLVTMSLNCLEFPERKLRCLTEGDDRAAE